jgi:hypothetical protein
MFPKKKYLFWQTSALNLEFKEIRFCELQVSLTQNTMS